MHLYKTPGQFVGKVIIAERVKCYFTNQVSGKELLKATRILKCYVAHIFFVL